MAKPSPPVQKKYTEMTADELEQDVRYHNYLYFTEAQPVISDYEFDRHVERLKKLRPESSVLQEIPQESEERPKVKHRSPMLSLEKAYDESDVRRWAEKFDGPIIASPKVDGLAVELRYNGKGRLDLAATRGNGIQGDLITENARRVGDIPERVPQGDVEIRGEIYMRRSVFRKHYQQSFANPRNLAAGAVKQKNPDKTGEYSLSFFAYGLLGSGVKRESDKFKTLQKWGVPTVETRPVHRDEIEAVYQYFLKKRDTYDYETDGVVYMADAVALQEDLGRTAHHPRWAVAYKYQGDSGVTTLKDVEWSVARSGVITPIGIVEPVTLSGATVSRVSLHNYGLMMQKKLRKGAEVIMVRRGGVIPYLEAVEKPGRGKRFRAPADCPSCGAPTEVREEFLYCTNRKGCTQSKLAELEHFIKTTEIDGFGPKLIAKLHESGLVSEPADFYDLREDALLELERMGETLAKKLIRNIQAKRRLNAETFLAALGLREVGRQVARVLVDYFGSFQKIRQATEEELTEVEGVGPVIAREIREGLDHKADSIARLLDHITLTASRPQRDGKWAGKKFCFTGEMAAMARSEAQKKVESRGGIATNSVTKDLDYLVVGSEGGAGGKLTKAKKYVKEGAGLNIIEENAFLKMIA